jgi:hypothetical protein
MHAEAVRWLRRAEDAGPQLIRNHPPTREAVARLLNRARAEASGRELRGMAGRRTPALRFGDPRVTALAGALASTLTAATGVTNKSLRALMTGLLGNPSCTPGQMTYDLRRLRLAGLIRRIEHTHRYVLTPDGIKFAVFYTKVHSRLLRPLMAADQPQAPPELRQALDTLNRHVDDYVNRARIGKAA